MDGMTAIEEFVNTIKEPQEDVATTYSGIVSRVDSEGTVWVYMAGSDKETPTASASSEIKRGDFVNLEWRNNKLYIVGNTTNPSAGVTRVGAVEQAAQVANALAEQASSDASRAKEAADQAETEAQRAHDAANDAQESADDAQKSADNANEYAARALGNLSTVQNVTETLNWITAHGTMTLTTDTAIDPTHVYFVRDNSGDYQVGNYHYSVVTEPSVSDLSTYYELSIDESLNNYVGTHLALTSEGLWLLPESTGSHKVLIATGSGSTYTTAGTYIIDSSNNVLAFFGASGAQIGKSGAAHSVIDADGQRFYAADGATQLANIGYGEGAAASGTAVAPYYTFGIRSTVGSQIKGNYSVAAGHIVEASGFASHAEGDTTIANAPRSHAEGSNTIASGSCTHAEGSTTSAYGFASHAEGYVCNAGGDHSHAEGYGTLANGNASHAQNNGTIARRKSQTALGEYNIADTGGRDTDSRGDYAVIIGNGTSDSARSNALTVDWDGNVEAAGEITDGNSRSFGNLITTALKTFSSNSWAKGNTNLSTLGYEPDTVSGYTCIGIVGASMSSQHCLCNCRLLNGQVVGRVRNFSSSAVDCTMTVDFLYMHD